MQLVKDGPNIPLEVLQDLEDGKLVFFCGAGISHPAGLPGFKDLVKQVYERLHEEMELQEEQAFKSGQYDRALGLLEDRLSRPSQVREAVIDILRIDANPSKLATHDSLLTLAKNKQGYYRLVTTNFDRGFVLVGRSDLKIDAAPKLPVPKDYRWNSLVHLHGLIDETDPEGNNLVITSADFGAAYLTERWASRFVSELFRRYTVLFVGYRVEDPVVRYMMDALAADRRQGDEQAKKAYVLAAASKAKKAVVEQEWRAKGIEPILYKDTETHSHLHKTLKVWADLHRDGLVGKEQIVQRHGKVPPKKPYDEIIGQVLWAISEETGHIAALFAKLEPLPPIEWLEVFETEGLLSQPDPTIYPANRIPLIDHGYRTTCPAPLNPITRSLGIWLSRHLVEQAVLEWVIRSGGCLHPEMRTIVRDQIRKNNLPKALTIIWQILSSEAHVCTCTRVDWIDFIDAIKEGFWGPILKRQLFQFLSPYVQFGLPWRGSSFTGEEDQAEEEQEPSVSKFVEANVKIRAGDMFDIILEGLNKLENRMEILSDLADGLTGLLIDTWELMAVLGKATERSDLSYISHPSITEHEQDQGFEDWTSLIDLVRDSLRELLKVNPASAKALVERWQTVRYPLFRRIVLFAMAESSIFSIDEMLSYLLADEHWWLWAVETQRESYRLLNSIGPKLNKDAAERLANAILEGPPRKMFRDDLSSEEWNGLVDKEVWSRLMKLKSYGSELTAIATQRLEELSKKYPEWKLQEGDKDEFPTWMESGWGFETSFSVEQLYSMNREELARTLLETRDNRAGLLDLWREMARKYPRRVITVLILLSARNSWVEDIWHSALNGFGGEKTYTNSWKCLASRLIGAPDEFISQAISHLAWWMRDVTKKLSSEKEALYWLLWDRLIAAAVVLNPGEFKDPVQKAINTPAGILTESLLDRMWVRTPKADEGLPREIISRITQIATGQNKSNIFCRIILSSRLHALFTIDHAWTKQNLIPYFRWDESPEAAAMWQGYLWLRRISPNLLAILKSDLLKALMRVDQLGDRRQQLYQLFAAICMEFKEGFTEKEMRDAVKSIEAAGRSEIAHTIYRLLKEAQKDSASYWTNRVEPWITSIWPKDRAMIDARTAKQFALISAAAGTEFERAVEVVEKYLQLIEDFSYVVHIIESTKIDDTPLAQKYPAATLKLLDAIVGDEGGWPDGLRNLLNQISQGDDSLTGLPSYRRLGEYLRRRGL